jgi:ethanolamine utilization protein EutN
MFLAKVTGSVVATQKVRSMVGYKLLIVEPYRIDAENRENLKTTGRTFVAIDTLGAGLGEYVLVTQGSSARLTPETKDLPIDAVIVGLVDQVEVEQHCVYQRSSDTAAETTQQASRSRSRPKS